MGRWLLRMPGVCREEACSRVAEMMVEEESASSKDKEHENEEGRVELGGPGVSCCPVTSPASV